MSKSCYWIGVKMEDPDQARKYEILASEQKLSLDIGVRVSSLLDKRAVKCYIHCKYQTTIMIQSHSNFILLQRKFFSAVEMTTVTAELALFRKDTVTV